MILGRYEAGFTDLKEAFRLRPETAWWANQIAWMRATLPDPAVRNPAEALHYAKIACRLTGNKNWHFVNTLAAALADAGRWDEAVALQEKVVVALGHSSEQQHSWRATATAGPLATTTVTCRRVVWSVTSSSVSLESH